MAKTYAELNEQIENLKREAETVRQRELDGVVARIREAITAYGLTAKDLGFSRANGISISAPKAGKRAKFKTAAKSSSGYKSAVRFRDSSGNTWTGRGPRPAWFKAALAKGQSAQDFAVSPAGGNGAAAKQPSTKTQKASKTTPKVKYKDGAGHTWSGRGPTPGWLKQLVSGGKKVEDFLA